MNYYFHLPFCRQKCAYCAFYSLPGAPAELIEHYLEHLELQLKSAPWPEADTIYIGGGTPTWLNQAQLERFFQLLRTYIPRTATTEISLEANPETLDAAKVTLLKSEITRLSLGVQSFSASLRQRIGRVCSEAALNRALELVSQAQFPHWNCDLIYAIPGQSESELFADLDQALALGIDHLSCYSLTPEEGSALGSGYPVDDEAGSRFWQLIGDRVALRGFQRYEISNYARPGGACRHNQKVWRGDLLQGFGPAAASFDGTDRRTEVADLNRWLANTAPEVDHITPEMRREEIFAVNLRTTAGWTPELWRTVPNADAWECRVARMQQVAATLGQEYISLTPTTLKLTPEGLLFWNSVAEELIFNPYEVNL